MLAVNPEYMAKKILEHQELYKEICFLQPGWKKKIELSELTGLCSDFGAEFWVALLLFA